MEYLEATQTQILEKQYLVFEDNWNIFKTNHCFGPGYALSAWQSPICTRCKGKDIYYTFPKLHKFLCLCVHLTSASIPHNLLHLNYVSWNNIEFWSVHYWLCLSSVHCTLEGWLETWNTVEKESNMVIQSFAYCCRNCFHYGPYFSHSPNFPKHSPLELEFSIVGVCLEVKFACVSGSFSKDV